MNRTIILYSLLENVTKSTYQLNLTANASSCAPKIVSIYRGNISDTYSHKTCQLWSSLSTRHQKNGFHQEQVKDLNNYKNYCRNPDNDPIGPWCFTTDVYTSWQYCIIPGYTVGICPTYLWHITNYIVIYIFPGIVILGTILNTLSICTFRRPSLRKKTTSFLLIILGVCDITVLYLGPTEMWLRIISKSTLSATNDLSCGIYVSVNAMVLTCSGWIIVIVTMERMISMAKPFDFASIFSQRNVIKLLTGMFLSICIFHIPFFLFIQSVHDLIFIENSLVFTIVAYCLQFNFIPGRIHIFIQCFIPSSLILVGNVILVVLLNKTNRRRRALLSTSDDYHQLNQTKTMAILLLTTSFTYLFLTLPYTVCLISDDYFRPLFDSHHSYNSAFHLWFTCALLCYYINSSVNFILYCIAGKHMSKIYHLNTN